MNKCPPEIKEGHCEECKAKQLKSCEACGGKKEVKYTHTACGWACLCYDCRMANATNESLRRSW